MPASTRKAARFDVNIKVLISYQINCERRLPQEGILLNISETGLRLKTESTLPKNAVVFVDLEVPGVEEKARAIGKVVWNNSKGEAGVKLEYIPAKQFKFFAPFLQSKSSSSSGAAVTSGADVR